MNADSPLALLIAHPRNEAYRRSKKASGGTFHTTGSNADDRKAYLAAKQAGKSEDDARAAVDARKIDYYDNPGANFPHYLIPWASMPDRKVAWQIAPEDDRSWAAGMGNASLVAYDDGTWVRLRAEGGQLVHLDTAYPGYKRWFEKWPGVQSPTRLLQYHGTRDPNQLIQVEVVQPVDGPFTDEQHSAMARLWVDIARRHGFAADMQRQALAGVAHPGTMGWPPILTGHGDVHPMARYNANGEWDPGEAPNFRRQFFWQLVLNWLQTETPASGLAMPE